MDGRHPELVEPVLPAEDDMFVIKTRHSVFFSTPLEYLLERWTSAASSSRAR